MRASIASIVRALLAAVAVTAPLGTLFLLVGLTEIAAPFILATAIDLGLIVIAVAWRAITRWHRDSNRPALHGVRLVSMPDNERTQRTEKGLEIAVPKRKAVDDALDKIVEPLPSEDDRQRVRDRAGDEPPPKGTGRPRK